jgi:hypothetical protein
MSEEPNKLTLKVVEEEPTPFAEWFEKKPSGRPGCPTPLEAFKHLMKTAKEKVPAADKRKIAPIDLWNMASEEVKNYRDSLLEKFQQDNLDAEHVHALCEWITRFT